MDERDQTIKVVVNGQSHEFSTAKELAINRHDLDQDMARQAALFAWFAVLREKARAERASIEADLEELSYELDQEVRAELAKTNPKERPTETEVKIKVRSKPAYRALVRRLLKAEEGERMLLAIVDALAQRKDMLVSLGRSRYLEVSALSADEVDRVKERIIGRRS